MNVEFDLKTDDSSYKKRDNEKLKDIGSTNVDVKIHEDLVINGLGFIKIVDKCTLKVYVNKNVEVFTRDSII